MPSVGERIPKGGDRMVMGGDRREQTLALLRGERNFILGNALLGSSGGGLFRFGGDGSGTWPVKESEFFVVIRDGRGSRAELGVHSLSCSERSEGMLL